MIRLLELWTLAVASLTRSLTAQTRLTTTVKALILYIPLALAPLTANAASVTNVTSTTPNGSYKAGAPVTIDVSFSESVTVSGTPQLRLETGATDALINYTSGSGSSTLRFTYTVSSGHTTSDLDYQSQSALTLNGGTIRNSSNVAASLTLPLPGAAGSLSANKNIQIDTTPPTVTLQAISPLTTNTTPIQIQVTFSEAVNDFSPLDPTITNGEVTGVSGSGSSYMIEVTPYANGNVTINIPANSAVDAALNGNSASTNITFVYDTNKPLVSNVTASPISGAYRAGQSANIIVTFSEAVTVSGTPSFTVETGASDGVATYLSGTGTTQLTFRYTVVAGQNSADLEYTASNDLVLNGGSIVDAASNAAILTLPNPGGAGSLSANANVVIDTILPDVTITSSISGDTALDAIPVVVVFSEAVTGFALSDFSVSNGCASNLRGSGTTYYADIVPRSHGTVTVTVPASIAIDVAGNQNTAAPTPVSVNFFTYGPKVTSVTSSTPNGAYRAGQTISIQVSFSDRVTVSGTPQLRLATGSIASVNYVYGSGTDTLTFDYTIANGQNSSDLDYTPLPPLLLNGGQIRDLATNSFDAAFTFACPGASGSLANAKNIIVDTIAPTVSRVTSTTANGAYRAGQTINVRTQFSESVFVTGSPALTLETGSNDAVINMASGSGTANLDFSYTIVDGHNSSRLDYTNTSALSANGATLIDQAGNVAVLTLPTPASANSLYGQKNLIIDTIPPVVPNVTSSSANGAYKAGTSISVQISFSETIYVTGSPRLALATGVANRYATYLSGNATNTLNFAYTVGSGDTTGDLDYNGVSALETNGGSLKDLAGNNAITTLAQPALANSLSANKNIQLDTTAPSITEVRSSTSNGSYSVGIAIPIDVVFSEPVNVTGTPYLVLNTAPSQATASYSSGTGTSTLRFSYTVAAGQNSINLDYNSTTAIILPTGAAVKDPATNDAVVTLALPGSAGSLAAQGQRQIDTTVPVITEISFFSPDGAYRAGSQIDIDVRFNEPIALNGALELQLATSSAFGRANCNSLSSSTTLRCSYTVQPGDSSNDLDYQSSAALSLSGVGSYLVDTAGNVAVLTLPDQGTATSLAGKGAVILDTTPPIATLASSTQPTTNANPIPITITFSEPVSGLALDDLSVTNGSVQNLTGSGTSYSCEVVPESDGVVGVELRSSSVTDAAGNPNSAPPTLQRTYDSTRPITQIDSSITERFNAPSFPITISFGEAVTDFDISDISVTNGTLSGFTGSARSYSATVQPIAEGQIEIVIPDNVAQDPVGNGNQRSNTLSRTFDSTTPKVVSVKALTPDGAYKTDSLIELEIYFSEAITLTGALTLRLETSSAHGVATCNSSISNSSLKCSYIVHAGDNSADLEYLSSAALTLGPSGSTVLDGAGNMADLTLPAPGETASLSAQSAVVLDTTNPTASLTSATQNTTNSSPIPVTITFSESVAGLALDDFTVTNGTIRNLSGSGDSYNCELAPVNEGVVLLELRNAAVSDAAGNTNSGPPLFQRIYDITRPTVRVDSSSSETSNTNLIPATITFSEAVTGFEASDISVTNGTIDSISGSGTTYSIQILPASDGPVDLFIPENIATDAGGNANYSSDTLSRFFDSTAPRILSVQSTTANGYYPSGTTINIQVIFSEPIYVTGSPSLILATGSSPATAQYTSGDGSDTLNFTYIVSAGDNSPDLDYTAINALEMLNSSIKDLATNSALAVLPNPGSAESLAGQKQLVIDTLAPGAPLISAPGTGEVIKRSQVTVEGSAEALSSVSLRNSDQKELCATTASEQGVWSCLLSELENGTYYVSAVSTDFAGNASQSSDQIYFVIDPLALDAPQFTEPANGISSDQKPTFSGTAPANKQVRVKKGSETLCVSSVSSSGNWSCQSTTSLAPGSYDINGITEDPGEQRTSAATKFNLIIGARLTGIVLYANRDLTPCKGVTVNGAIRSTTTEESGVFSLIVPDINDPKLTMTKFGWRIKRSETLSKRAIDAGASAQWLAVPALEPESYTIWNGGIKGISQKLRLLNRSSDQTATTVTLYRHDGTQCSETIASEVAARTNKTLSLNNTSCFTADGYGLLKVRLPAQDYDATLITHSDLGALDRYLASYNELPLTNTLTGRSFALFDNAYHKIRRSQDSYALTNELFIGNPTATPKGFTVRRYLSNGALSATWRLTVSSMGSYKLPTLESDQSTPQNGIHEIEPDDMQSPYIAIQMRRGSQNGTRFIYMSHSETGFGATRFARVRYLNHKNAVQYAEIANVSDQPINLRIKRISRTGETRPTIPLLLNVHETRKLRISRLLERYSEGVAEISSDRPDSIIVTSVIKHYRPDNRLLSMKSTPIQELFGDLVYGAYNTRDLNKSLLKISNMNQDPASATVMCYAKKELINAQEIQLRPGRMAEINLAQCFLDAQRGTVEVNSSAPGSMVVDLLKFREAEGITLDQRLR